MPDNLNGPRLGIIDVARRGMTAADTETLARFITRALVANRTPEPVAEERTAIWG